MKELKLHANHRTLSRKFLQLTLKVIFHRRLVQAKIGLKALNYELSINFGTL